VAFEAAVAVEAAAVQAAALTSERMHAG